MIENHKSKTSALMILGTMLGLAGCPIEVNDEVKSSEKQIGFTIDADEVELMRVDSINGTITIIGSKEVNAIEVNAVAYVRAPTYAAAEAELDNLDVQAMVVNGELEVYTVQPSADDRCEYTVHYTISVPAELDVNVAGVNGEIVAEGLDAGVAIALTNGSIAATAGLATSGLVELTVVNGDIWLAVPEDASATVCARVERGVIKLEDLDSANFMSTRTSLVGILGAGAGEIRLGAVNGEITLTSM